MQNASNADDEFLRNELSSQRNAFTLSGWYHNHQSTALYSIKWLSEWSRLGIPSFADRRPCPAMISSSQRDVGLQKAKLRHGLAIMRHAYRNACGRVWHKGSAHQPAHARFASSLICISHGFSTGPLAVVERPLQAAANGTTPFHGHEFCHRLWLAVLFDRLPGFKTG